MPNKEGAHLRLLFVIVAPTRETPVFESYCKENLGPLALRLALGFVCVYHGYVKIMASGGTTWYPGMPVVWQLLIAWGEFGAGLAILLGFRCRLAAALVVALTMGTLMWFQGWHLFQMPLHSLEPTVLLVLMGLALLFLGAGELSVDSRGTATTSSSKPAKKR
jgi:uncharacterized membrane protein YphA (DoxX/SURF4 family)